MTSAQSSINPLHAGMSFNKEVPGSTSLDVHHKTHKSFKIFWKKFWFYLIFLPFCISCIYFGFIATDRYVGEAKVIVKKADTNGNSDMGFSILGTGSTPDALDSQLVREFILSLDMLHHLNELLSLKNHYQNEKADLLSRLWNDSSQEEFLDYYRKHLTVDYNDISGVLTIRAQAFAPEFAQQLVTAVMKRSEQYINEIGHRLAAEQVAFVQKELDRASEHLRTAKQQIIEFQNKYQIFNPEQESGAKLNTVNQLDAELTRSKAELNNLRSYMNESAADVLALKAKITALETQLVVERSKLVGNDNNNFSDVNAKYADLLLDLEFATDQYKASLRSLEQARIEAYQKLKHLVVVDSPSLPETSEYPRRIYNLISIFVILVLLYGAAQITIATIREHRDV